MKTKIDFKMIQMFFRYTSVSLAFIIKDVIYLVSGQVSWLIWFLPYLYFAMIIFYDIVKFLKSIEFENNKEEKQQ